MNWFEEVANQRPSQMTDLPIQSEVVISSTTSNSNMGASQIVANQWPRQMTGNLTHPKRSCYHGHGCTPDGFFDWGSWWEQLRVLPLRKGNKLWGGRLSGCGGWVRWVRVGEWEQGRWRGCVAIGLGGCVSPHSKDSMSTSQNISMNQSNDHLLYLPGTRSTVSPSALAVTRSTWLKPAQRNAMSLIPWEERFSRQALSN